MRKIKIIKISLGTLCLIYALASTMTLSLQIGNLCFWILGFLLSADGLRLLKVSPSIQRRIDGFWKIFMIWALALAWLMGEAAYGQPVNPQNPPPTMIVLGAKVNGTNPSLILERRLEAALNYAHNNPEVNIVVTGGQGTDEELPEGEVMKSWLIARGIDENRIIAETQARNTGENFRFSASLIDQAGWGTDVLLVTDNFHQLRAVILAEIAGLNPAATLSSETPWSLVPVYAVRESFGLLKALVLRK